MAILLAITAIMMFGLSLAVQAEPRGVLNISVGENTNSHPIPTPSLPLKGRALETGARAPAHATHVSPHTAAPQPARATAISPPFQGEGAGGDGVSQQADPRIPRAAHAYRGELQRAATRVWGRSAPIPAFAAQIHQESGWRPNVCSAYACGLTQFTTATAQWMQATYGVELGPGDRTNARWAIRAMVRYMHHVHADIKPMPVGHRAMPRTHPSPPLQGEGRGGDGSLSDCSRYRFALSSYNGGPGWVTRDRALAARRGADPNDYDQVAPHNAGRAAWAIAENRDYPKRIIARQALYQSWGGRMVCNESIN